MVRLLGLMGAGILRSAAATRNSGLPSVALREPDGRRAVVSLDGDAAPVDLVDAVVLAAVRDEQATA